jgi:transposase
MAQPSQPTSNRDHQDPPRLRVPDRQRLAVQPRTLDDLVGPDHPVRMVWAVVLRWDLSAFLAVIKARGDRPGRAATDPRLLIALWLYAYLEGLGCGRELAERCARDDPYRWLCGGVSLNYHTLNDFAVGHGAALDDLLSRMIAVLVDAGVVSAERIAQDGTRARAAAGANSFLKREALEEHLRAARRYVEAIKRQAADPGASAQQAAARRRAARERVQRLERALEELKEVERAKAAQKDKPTKENPPRASSTDPEARFMRMPDGGTRPAYNVQLSTDVESRAIVGVEVTNAGSDAGLDAAMRGQVEDRTDEAVDEQLLDGGYVKLESIDRAEAEGTTLYMPVPEPRKPGVDRFAPKPGDSEPVARWRQRMATDEAKAIYKQRAATIETVNGETKAYRGLGPVLVRGLSKVQCVATWSALAYNLVHYGWLLAEG